MRCDWLSPGANRKTILGFTSILLVDCVLVVRVLAKLGAFEISCIAPQDYVKTLNGLEQRVPKRCSLWRA